MSQRARLETALSDRYRLVRELGRGGTATVWLAEDLRHRRQVALKTLHPELAATLGTERFLREIEIAAGLAHPNILPLYESGEAGGILYYTMPVVDGESLRDRLTREIQLPLDEALRITAEVADALAYAHARGVIHRDIKPENILFQSGHAVVADFGIAKALASAAGESLTATGLAVGTPAYMSPEQAAGSHHVDGRSDVYALGCVLFEMLAGEPPFTAPTPQALAAKHQQALPPKVRLTRKTVPEWVDAVIERALAKVPADRHSTAYALREAIEQGTSAPKVEVPGRRWPWRKLALFTAGAAVAVSLASALWTRVPVRPGVLDEFRVVIFPLRVIGNAISQTEGEAVATYVGYALDGSEPLRWLDGWDYLSQRERQALDTLSVQRAAEVTRKVLARYFIDGSVVRGNDSVAVVLRLHDVRGDSVIKRAGASQPAKSADPPVLGLRAVSQLLPALVDPGREIDLRYLGDRHPAAIAAFLQGERSYRRMWFKTALDSYKGALAIDSQLAVAAVRGSQAALLLERYDEARILSQLVLDGRDALSLRYAPFARGLLFYLDGRADSAVAAFKQAIARDETSAEAWTALGETYYHLLPSGDYHDSLPTGAFRRAEALDSTFTPALTHLAHVAIRKGDLAEASRLIEKIELLEPRDSDPVRRLNLMLRCVRDGTTDVSWKRVTNPTGVVLPVARMLSVGGLQLECAEAAYQALWHAPDSANPDWGRVFGLASVLAARGKAAELTEKLTSEVAAGMGGQYLLLLASAAGVSVHEKADSIAQEYLGRRAKDPTTTWLVGEWAATQGDSVVVAKLLSSLRAVRDTFHRRADSVMVTALEIQLSLLRGDTAEALRLFSMLTPSGPPTDLEWYPWEAFAVERVKIAEVLADQGRWARAATVAEQFDSPAAVVYVMFIRRALEVRIRAAQAMGQRQLADSLQDRLQRLNQKSVLSLTQRPTRRGYVQGHQTREGQGKLEVGRS